MFSTLKAINSKPKPYEFCTVKDLWTNDHVSKKMLEYHLNESVDAASRNHAFIGKSCEWIIKKFGLGEGSKVIDFGCGPGLYTSRLAECGASVTGIDFSRRSIEYAVQSARGIQKNITYINADYLSFDSGDTFDLIIMIMCDFTALSPAQRSTLLATFRKLLKPAGSILLDVYSYAYFDLARECSKFEFNMMGNFWSADDYYCFHNGFKYDREMLLLDRYAIVTPREIRNVYNWFQCYSRESVVDEFAAHDLRITEFFSNVAGDEFIPETSEFALVAGLM